MFVEINYANNYNGYKVVCIGIGDGPINDSILIRNLHSYQELVMIR